MIYEHIHTYTEGAKKMYTHFKKGKMVLRSSNDNRASAIFFLAVLPVAW